MTATERPSDLKPCPFCGSDRVRVAPVRDGLRVSCGACGAAGPPIYYGREGQEVTGLAAVAAWNLHAREIDAAPINPQEVDSRFIVEPSAEHWRGALMRCLNTTDRTDALIASIEKSARELAREGK